MLQQPPIYRQYDRTPLDGVYKALRHKDFADCVLRASVALERSNNWKEFSHKEKSTTESLQYRLQGKEAFCAREYQNALKKYNMALMLAPPNSEAMRLSYYDRAELLMKTKQYQACVKDVETCLALNCPDSMVLKLREMKGAVSNFIWIEQWFYQQASNPYTEEFFKLKGAPNPDIPFATSHVEVKMVSGNPKVVAARDIPVGTVVAVETAFVGATHSLNYITSCHYCYKMDFNLMPCEGCCAVMFCDKRCKEKAMQDGHNIECKITELILDDISLPFRATLKIRQLCSSWDEFISASYGLEHPIEKAGAIRAVSRVMMHLAIHCTPVRLKHFAEVCTEDRMTLLTNSDLGYFPFIGTLRNSCLPNSYTVGLRNSAALITIAPVKKGDELTISYIGHWLEEIPTETLIRTKRLAFHYRTVCRDCIICGGRADIIMLNSRLSNAQARAFKKFVSYAKTMVNISQTIKSDYKETCKILLALSDAPCSKEYVRAFVSFARCIMHCVQFKYPNVMMAESD
ncbi:hypothetical protein PYW07_005386 [Mythimna separata]|uniref:MYND-type domain-containing protein n=1 Tax=Mythimna separata TaxID=271217 RepID=A0AAD7YE88_MYTSE|nr:hypothetical protein PYW07_005386 [Mythimna separata]